MGLTTDPVRRWVSLKGWSTCEGLPRRVPQRCSRSRPETKDLLDPDSEGLWRSSSQRAGVPAVEDNQLVSERVADRPVTRGAVQTRIRRRRMSLTHQDNDSDLIAAPPLERLQGTGFDLVESRLLPEAVSVQAVRRCRWRRGLLFLGCCRRGRGLVGRCRTGRRGIRRIVER